MRGIKRAYTEAAERWGTPHSTSAFEGSAAIWWLWVSLIGGKTDPKAREGVKRLIRRKVSAHIFRRRPACVTVAAVCSAAYSMRQTASAGECLDERCAMSAGSKDVTIAKLSSNTGAEVTGVDLTRPLQPELRDRLTRAFVEHSVLVIRDQIGRAHV